MISSPPPRINPNPSQGSWFRVHKPVEPQGTKSRKLIAIRLQETSSKFLMNPSFDDENTLRWIPASFLSFDSRIIQLCGSFVAGEFRASLSRTENISPNLVRGIISLTILICDRGHRLSDRRIVPYHHTQHSLLAQQKFYEELKLVGEESKKSQKLVI